MAKTHWLTKHSTSSLQQIPFYFTIKARTEPYCTELIYCIIKTLQYGQFNEEWWKVNDTTHVTVSLTTFNGEKKAMIMNPWLRKYMFSPVLLAFLLNSQQKLSDFAVYWVCMHLLYNNGSDFVALTGCMIKTQHNQCNLIHPNLANDKQTNHSKSLKSFFKY